MQPEIYDIIHFLSQSHAQIFTRLPWKHFKALQLLLLGGCKRKMVITAYLFHNQLHQFAVQTLHL